MTKILVTGGSGLVGTHLKDLLPNAVYVSSKEYNLLCQKQTEDMFLEHRPDAVIHLAARVGGIKDNISHPVEYIEENTLINTNVIKNCHTYNVNKVIAILSTCVYPDTCNSYPVKESDLFNGPPADSNFAYSMSKRCMATQIDSYVKQYDKKWSYLIPCNLYSEYDKYEEHNSHFVSALIKKIHEAEDHIELWGTGKPLRQFMYGKDFADIILYILNNNIVGNFNVAPDWTYSINEMAEIAKIACKKKHLSVVYKNPDLDGQFRKDVDSSKLLEAIGAFKFTSLHNGIEKVYKAMRFKWEKQH